MFLFAFLLGLSAFAQNFPGKKIELLKDKTLKVLPEEESLQRFGYRGFYTDHDLQNVYRKEGTTTLYSALAGKEFKVISYEEFRMGFNNEYLFYKLLIENPETGKLYFKYNPEYSHTFPFEVIGGLAYPEGFFCESIVEEKGNVVKEGDRWYEAPMDRGIKLSRYKGQLNPIYIQVNVPTDVAHDETIVRRGYVITFENGKTIAKPTKELISFKGPTGKTVITTDINLYEESELKLLKEQKIKSVKLDKFEMNLENGFTLREYAKCLIAK
jgi:hypothetical protein